MKREALKTPLKFKLVKRGSASAVAMALTLSLALSVLVPASADTKSKSTGRGLTEDQKIIHLLNRIGFGPRPGDVERVRAIGINKFIEQQLNPERIDDQATDARLKGLESLGMTIAEIYDKYPQPNQVARQLGLRPGKNQQANPASPANPGAQNNDPESQQEQRQLRRQVLAYYAEKGLRPPQALLQEMTAQKIIRAVYSERQLQEVMTDFWFNHFNIDWRKGADKWMLTDYEMNAIRPHTLGKFKDLVMATAKSPAMLFYLDNFQSMSPDTQIPQQRRRMQGRPGGLGNPRLNNQRNNPLNNERQSNQEMRAGEMTANQQPQQLPEQLRNRKRGINENYARELMELHTLGVGGGYTQKDVQEVARAFTGWTIDQPRRNGQFIFRPRMHDNGEKIVLGQQIPAGGGVKDGEKVIDILTHNPNTAKFISTKLVRRFVSDDPPQSLVSKVTDVYMKTDGDISEMLRAIIVSPEFYSQEAYRAKIKSPFELAVSALRAVGGEVGNTMQLAQFVAKMGQPLYQYQPPTGYPDRAEQWVNTGALLERLNFGLALSSSKIRGTSVDLKRVAPGVDSSNKKLVMDKAIAVLLNNEVSPQTRQVLDRQLKEGVAVKGELDNSKPARMSADDGEAMIADDSMQNRRGGNNDGGRRGRLLGLNNGAFMQPVQLTPSQAEVAKAFGLVFGSPEFQRK